MPYIKKELRSRFEYFLNLIPFNLNIGDINYIITSILLKYTKYKPHNYEVYNSLIGVLECAKLELYRRMVAPYEDEKIKENGDVYVK